MVCVVPPLVGLRLQDYASCELVSSADFPAFDMGPHMTFASLLAAVVSAQNITSIVTSLRDPVYLNGATGIAIAGDHAYVTAE